MLIIRNHADRFIELDGVAVQQLERFALAAPAHIHAAVDLVQIEHVRRTAQFEHHVVRDVDQRGDAALARALQTLDHPLRRLRARIHAANHTARETAAQVRRRNLDRQGFVQRDGGRLDVERVQRCAGDGRRFARHAEHRQAVRLVRRQLDFEDGVVEVERLADVLANRRIFRQDHQAAMIFRKLQFACRAQHALAFHAAQLRELDRERRAALFGRRQFCAHQRDRHLDARRDIRCAADDVERRARAGVDLTHVELVRVRVLDDLENPADNDLLGRRRSGPQALDFESRHRQRVRQLVRRHLRVDKAS